MKFQCISCDERMNLLPLDAPEHGSITAVYRCPSCAHEIAMMTNPQETDLVASLGLKIGGMKLEATSAPSNGEMKCPFTGAVAQVATEKTAGAGQMEAIPWSPNALERLQNIPEFVRPMAKQGIEKLAIEHDFAEITEDVLDQAKEHFGM